LLAAAGFHVHGIERSPDMMRLAALVPRSSDAGSFSCELGDVRSVVVDRRFDAAIALFHVISYQTTDNDLRATFGTAARHIKTSGLFLFDVWHGPAVLMQRPQKRLKSVGNDELEVIRTARPQLDTVRRTVKVTYDIECRDRHSGSVTRFTEDHLMRYLFPDEIASFASQSGMRVIASEEFITGRPPSSLTWSVAYVLRK
jgi:hypothetical protein